MIKKILLMICLFFILGCNKYYLADLFFDQIVLWKVNQYLNLKSHQELQFKAIVKDIKTQFVPNQIPKVQEHLKKLLNQIQFKQLSEATMSEIAEDFNQLIVSLENSYSEPAIKILLSLDLDQVQHFKSTLNKENKKIDEKINLSSQESFEDEVTKWTDRFEGWLGSLSKDQLSQLEKQIQITTYPNIERLKFRKNFQEKIFTLLNDKKQDEIQQFLSQYKKTHPDYLAYQNKLIPYQKSWQIFLKNFLNTLSLDQLAHLTNEFNKLHSFLDKMK